MALPKIDLPVYELTIPSTRQEVKVRPFTVKEEKLLLIAMESKDINEIIATTKQIINNCIIDGKIDVDKLPFFDIDYVFVFLRAKSIGEKVPLKLTCNNVVKGKECGNVFSTDLDISDVDIVETSVSNDIKLDKINGVRMKYPTYSVIKHLESSSEIDKKTSIIVNSIDYIYDNKGMYSSKDYSRDDLKKFVEDLTEANYKKLEEFVDNFPVTAIKLSAKCNKCGFVHNVRYSDFFDFFT